MVLFIPAYRHIFRLNSCSTICNDHYDRVFEKKPNILRQRVAGLSSLNSVIIYHSIPNMTDWYANTLHAKDNRAL